MTNMMTMFILLNICVVLIAYRSSSYLQTDHHSMDDVLDKITTTGAYAALNYITFISSVQARCTITWLNVSKDNIINATEDWLNNTIENIIMIMQEYISTANDWVTEHMHIEHVEESQFGIWFIKHDPFKDRGMYERCVLHVAGIMAIIACFIKVLLVETARLRYTPPIADDYQGYCRCIESILAEHEKVANEMRQIPKHGLNKRQRRGIIDLTNKHLTNIVLRRQQKEQKIKRNGKSKSLINALSVICGL
ncbi:unnamed protein product [Owenia fusiformis]|uniref:Uncharacterized protein n=1 Tax=Owenia fusiformis TaxID=6347 RepID=A0A8S4PHN9_OWEFU|nr:unnamed protein product [Owenia fusiformis]